MGVVINYNVIKWVWIRYSMPRPVLDTRNRSTGIEYSSTLVSNRPSLAIKPADNYYICRPLKFTWKNYCKAKGLKIFQGRDKFFSGLTILPPWLKLSASELIFRSYSGEPAIPHFDNRTAGRVWPQSTLLRVLLECNCGVQHPFINTLLSRDFIFFLPFVYVVGKT